MDLHVLMFLFPVGVFLLFKEMRDEHVFVVIYAVVGSYFAGVMVRLMLTLTPVVCVAAAIALSTLLDTYIDPVEPVEEGDAAAGSSGTVANDTAVTAGKKAGKKAVDAPTSSTASTTSQPTGTAATRKSGIFGLDTRILTVANVILLLCFFVHHCTWVTSNAYSSPSVILSSKNRDGSLHIIDDFREAYYWLRQNTAPDSVICSWWDYGYQIAGMADRPTLVDNNTWNNSEFDCVRTHLALRLTGMIS